MSRSLNTIKYILTPGDFVCAEPYDEEWKCWRPYWGIYLIEFDGKYKSAKDPGKSGRRGVICLGAANAYSTFKYDKPNFWNGLFRGQVMYDDRIADSMGSKHYENTLKVRKNLDEWIEKAKEYSNTL